MTAAVPGSGDTDDFLLTVKQALEVLHISRSSLYKQFQAGHITPVRIGGRVLVPRREITRIIDEALGKSA